MKVIFLDVDGVCNNWGFLKNLRKEQLGAITVDSRADIMPEKLELLNSLGGVTTTGSGASFTSVSSQPFVVISSSWRLMFPKDINNWLKELGLKLTIIGHTPGDDSNMRCNEIKSWLATWKGESISHFCIVDDYHDAEIYDRFVQTNPEMGLTIEDVAKINKILGY